MKEKQASSHSFIKTNQPIEIVGLGLAGATLATLLEERGQPFVVYDVPLPGRSSIIAPGIINPLAGKKFNPPNEIHEYLKASQYFFQKVEKNLNITLWHPTSVRRIFHNESQISYWEKANQNPNAIPFLGPLDSPNSLGSHVKDTFGSFHTRSGAWVDLSLWLSILRKKLSDQNQLIETIAPSELPPKNTLRIYCEGWRASENNLWKHIPWNPAKGEMIIVEFSDAIPRNTIYNKSCWLQPLPNSNRWRCGATYSWNNFNSSPEPEATTQLQERLRNLTPIPFKIHDQVAGVRPIIETYKPIATPHPQHPSLFIINGLGSKGILQAPHLIKSILT